VTGSGELVLDRLRGLPGGLQLLELAVERDDVELVGGAARDLLLGLTPRELDVVVASDAGSFALDLAGVLGLSDAEELDQEGSTPPGASSRGVATSVHERFGTAVVSWEAGRIDIARRRAESYPAPGALPEVRAGTPEQDLERRDFTVNAIAVGLGGPHKGALATVRHALEDLTAGRLRILHEGSFHDDPTRLLRLARYRARLGFEPELRTAELAAEALASGALATLSRARVGAELRLALAEPDALAALAAMDELGVLAALSPPFGFVESLARSALSMLPADGQPEVLLLACLLLAATASLGEAAESTIIDTLDEMEFTAPARDRALATALLGPGLVGRLDAAESASQVCKVVGGVPVETVALAGALADQQQRPAGGAAARRWLDELRHVRLHITGDDLLAAGIPAGPEIGRRLQGALRRKLDGELADGREAELSAAMEGA
jgi:tRNA nucleotidyltransferase (CCA-adding enzyme)